MVGNRLRQFSGHEKNAKQRKLRYIRAKNLMTTFPDCTYDGLFYCNIVEHEDGSWGDFIDFRFFHTEKKRYFATSLSTCAGAIALEAEDQSWEDADKEFPTVFPTALDDILSEGGSTNWDDPREDFLKKWRWKDERYNEIISQDHIVKPYMKTVDYGPVAVGLWATVNKPAITVSVVKEFIARFRKLGQPTAPGWILEDEEVTIGKEKLSSFRIDLSERG